MIAGGERRLKRWSLEEYRRLVDLDVFGPEAKVELVDGEILEKMGAKPKHSTTVARLGRVFGRFFSEDYHVREEKPVEILSSEPEPDIAVVRGSLEAYSDHHPRAENLLLLVEVADSSLDFDRGPKAALYARAGIEEYWLLDLNARLLSVYRSPRTDGGWNEIRTYGPEENITPLAGLRVELPIAQISVADLLPPL